MMVRVYDVKGQGLSMSTIIIAALALLVLVILASLILMQGGNMAEAFDCKSNDGVCANKTLGCPEGKIKSNSYNCKGDDICCINIEDS